MTLALLQALAIATAGLSSLGSVLIVLLLLNSKAGVRAGLAYFLGYTGSYLVLGLASLWLGQLIVPLDSGGSSGGPSPVRAGLAVALGLLLFALTLYRRRNPPSQEPGPPSFLAKLDSLTPVKAFGFGVLVTLINFKNLAIYLSAMAVLAAAKLPPVQAAISVLATDLVFCAGLAVPLLIVGLFPRRAEAWLAGMRRWIETNSHKATMIVMPILACLFLVLGCRSLWLLYGPPLGG